MSRAAWNRTPRHMFDNDVNVAARLRDDLALQQHGSQHEGFAALLNGDPAEKVTAAFQRDAARRRAPPDDAPLRPGRASTPWGISCRPLPASELGSSGHKARRSPRLLVAVRSSAASRSMCKHSVERLTAHSVSSQLEHSFIRRGGSIQLLHKVMTRMNVGLAHVCTDATCTPRGKRTRSFQPA